MRRVGELGQAIRGKRWIVLVAVAVGLGFAVERAVHHASLWDAFMKGCAASVALIVVLSLIDNLWRGREVDEATLPGGGGVRFAQAAERPILLTNRRVSKQMEELSSRILDVEQALESIDARTTELEAGKG